MFSTSKIRLSLLSVAAAAVLAMGMAGPASAHHKKAKHVSVHVVKQSANGGSATAGNGGNGGNGGSSGAVVTGASLAPAPGPGPVVNRSGGGNFGGAGGAGGAAAGGAGGVNTNTGATITSTDNSVHANI